MCYETRRSRSPYWIWKFVLWMNITFGTHWFTNSMRMWYTPANTRIPSTWGCQMSLLSTQWHTRLPPCSHSLDQQRGSQKTNCGGVVRDAPLLFISKSRRWDEHWWRVEGGPLPILRLSQSAWWMGQSWVHFPDVFFAEIWQLFRTTQQVHLPYLFSLCQMFCADFCYFLFSFSHHWPHNFSIQILYTSFFLHSTSTASFDRGKCSRNSRSMQQKISKTDIKQCNSSWGSWTTWFQPEKCYFAAWTNYCCRLLNVACYFQWDGDEGENVHPPLQIWQPLSAFLGSGAWISRVCSTCQAYALSRGEKFQAHYMFLRLRWNTLRAIKHDLWFLVGSALLVVDPAMVCDLLLASVVCHWQCVLLWFEVLASLLYPLLHIAYVTHSPIADGSTGSPSHLGVVGFPPILGWNKGYTGWTGPERGWTGLVNLGQNLTPVPSPEVELFFPC